MLKHLCARLCPRGRRAVMPWLAVALAAITTFTTLTTFAATGGGASTLKPLSLPRALQEALANNPELEAFAPRLRALEGRRYSADQAPAYSASLDAENLSGSGGYRGGDAAEFTLSLSSVIELGGKREARTRVADQRLMVARARQTAAALDLLGEVTRQFVGALALQEKLKLADEALALAEALNRGVARRVERGASPRAELLRARSQLATTRLDRQRLAALYRAELAALASLLGREGADFARLEGDILAIQAQAPFDRLWDRARDNPQIRVLAGEERLRDAELALANSRSRSDISWQLGARYLAESDDAALVAGFSVPLYSGRRNRGEVRAARAAREEAGLQREAALLALRARLYRAYREFEQAREAVKSLREAVIPDLREALELTREAYELGRYGYVEWQSAWRERLDAESALVDAATTALLNQSFIEQLTADSIAPSSTVPTPAQSGAAREPQLSQETSHAGP